MQSPESITKKTVRFLAPSSTSKEFSGIVANSTHANAYYPIKARKWAPPVVPTIDGQVSVLKVHYGELGRYLEGYLASNPNSLPNPGSNLMRLTLRQLYALSIDYYDELIRRKDDQKAPYLPFRKELLPRRNQRRRSLANLPTTRFKDYSCNVYFELARRYPEFVEDFRREARMEKLRREHEPSFSIIENQISTLRSALKGASKTQWRPQDSEVLMGLLKEELASFHQNQEAPLTFQRDKKVMVKFWSQQSSFPFSMPNYLQQEQENSGESNTTISCSEASSYTNSTDYGLFYTRMALSDESDNNF